MSSAKLIVLKDGEKIKEHTLDHEVLMGRSAECGLKIDHQSISREHAQFKVIDSGIELVKKSKFAPLVVNGAECTSAILKQGDVIMVGPYLIQVQLDQDARNDLVQSHKPLEIEQNTSLNEVSLDEAVSTSDDNQPNLEQDEVLLEQEQESASVDEEANPIMMEQSASIDPNLEFNDEISNSDENSMASHELDLGDDSFASSDMNSFDDVGESDQTALISSSHMSPKLYFDEGLANVTEIEIGDEPVVVGRGKNADVILNDKKASRKHASFEKIGTKFYVIDHESVNGTFLNGHQIEKEELSGDDVIRIGDSEFNFRVTNLDYEKNKESFLEADDAFLPEVNPEQQVAAHAALEGLQSNPNIAHESTHSGAFTMGGTPEAVDPSLLGKFKALPRRKQILYGVVLLLMVSFFFEDEEVPQAPEQRTVASDSKKDEKKEVAFESLSDEQKRFVESQRELAFEHYRNQEFDKALFEIRKVFQIIPDYKNSKEIERYAIEGKRKLERLKEEEKQKEEQDRIKLKIADLKKQIQSLMAEKNYQQAKALFPEIIALDPESKEMHQWKAEIQDYYDEIERAERQKRIQKQLLDEAWAIYKDASKLKNDNKCFDAIKLQTKADELNVKNSKLTSAFSNLITDCRNIISNQVEPLLEEAKIAEESGNEIQAYKLFEKVLVVDPVNRDGKNGEKRLRNLLHERAKLAYTEAVVAESYSDFETARVKFEECLNISPKGDSYRLKAEKKLNRFLSLQRLEASE